MARDARLLAAMAYDGMGTFELGIVSEVFGLARPELSVPWYRLAVFALERRPLRASGGVHVAVPYGLGVLRTAGTIVIPGWHVDTPPPDLLVRRLRAAHEAGARLVSICSGVFVLAATGLLDGKLATTHWRYAGHLAARHPQIRVDADRLYIDEGSILTSAGSAAGIDLCLHIVRRDYGAEIANSVARRLVMPPHRDGGQAQYVADPIRQRPDEGLAPVLAWAQANLGEPIHVDDLARRAAMSPRTFARQFLRQNAHNTAPMADAPARDCRAAPARNLRRRHRPHRRSGGPAVRRHPAAALQPRARHFAHRLPPPLFSATSLNPDEIRPIHSNIPSEVEPHDWTILRHLELSHLARRCPRQRPLSISCWQL